MSTPHYNLNPLPQTHFSSQTEFKQILENLRLQKRGAGGVDAEAVDGLFDISNADRLGQSEVELLQVNCLRLRCDKLEGKGGGGKELLYLTLCLSRTVLLERQDLIDRVKTLGLLFFTLCLSRTVLLQHQDLINRVKTLGLLYLTLCLSRTVLL